MNDQDFYDEMPEDELDSSDDLMSAESESHDLPDLDMLLDTSGMEYDSDDDDPVEPLFEEAAPDPEPEPEPESLPEPFVPQTIRFDPVFAVLRDSRDGRLAVQIDGAIYRSLAEVPSVKKKFFALIKELSQVINSPDDRATVPMVVTESPPKQQTPAPPPVKKAASAPRAPEPSKKPVPPAKKRRDDEVPGMLPTYNMEDSSVEKRGMFGRKIFEPRPVPELNVGGAIEEFLQYKLEDMPEFAGREIHVHNVPGGFVSIQVDDKHYEAVSDVEDVEIREFLSATIQEWYEHHK